MHSSSKASVQPDSEVHYLFLCVAFANILFMFPFYHIFTLCLAGAVANVTDSQRCCNPKVLSSIPAGGKDFPWARKFNHIALCRGGAHKSTGPLCVCSELKIRQVKDPTCSQGCSVAKFAM